MKLYTREMLTRYMQDDWILRLLHETEEPIDAQFRMQQWHKEIEAKRMIYADLYGDLYRNGRQVMQVTLMGNVK